MSEGPISAIAALLADDDLDRRDAGIRAASRARVDERLGVLRLLLDEGRIERALDLAALGDGALRDWLHRARWIYAARKLVWLHDLLGHPLPGPELLAALEEMTVLMEETAFPPPASARVRLGALKQHVERALRQAPSPTAAASSAGARRGLAWEMADAAGAEDADPGAFWSAYAAEHAAASAAESLAVLAPWRAAPSRLLDRFAEVSAFRALEARWRSDWAALSRDTSLPMVGALDLEQRTALSEAADGVREREERHARRHLRGLLQRCPALQRRPSYAR